VAIDRDPGAVARAEHTLRGLPVCVAVADYRDLPEVLAEVGIERVDGILLDLGLSSDQLADVTRGFSFQIDGPLDLRFNPQLGEPAWRLLDRLSEKTLSDMIYAYGEDRHSRRIARAICQARRVHPVRTARELAQLVRDCVPANARRQRIDAATRTFQALRIVVNDELNSLRIALRRLPDLLVGGGRLAIISFHSLEDRLVKGAFRDDPRLRPLTRQPVRPDQVELQRNPRCRSARMRVAQRL
jgi:16S rRNA (cytosine1402-N4)-methyltransferase